MKNPDVPTRKKPGPKPKVRRPQDEIEQITVRLGRGLKAALELVGRDLRVSSINETIVYCLEGTLRNYDIDGRSALAIGDAIEGIENADFSIKGLLVAGHELGDSDARQLLAAFFRKTGIFRALQMPARLRTPLERYLVEAMSSVQNGVLDIRDGAGFLAFATEGMRAGKPASTIGTEWNKANKKRDRQDRKRG